MRIKRTTAGLEVFTPFDKDLIANLKLNIPYDKRRPIYINKKFSHWLVNPSQEGALMKLAKMNGYTPRIVGTTNTIQGKQTKIFKVTYIGSVKDRADGSKTALGLVDDDWAISFSEKVLKNWFLVGDSKDDNKPNEETLYTLLNIDRNCSSVELKKAYRRAVMRWHPDRNSDDTSEQFIKVDKAYKVLKNSTLRKKYNAALSLQSKLNQPVALKSKGFRPPIKCGLIMFEGQMILGRWHVDKILSWQDIKNNQGQVLVTNYIKSGYDFILKKEWI